MHSQEGGTLEKSRLGEIRRPEDGQQRCPGAWVLKPHLSSLASK